MNDPAKLTPEARALYYAHQAALEAEGIEARPTCTLRTLAEQTALYAQGRQPLEVVNNLRKVAGLWPITEAENRKKVTGTMHSRHLAGEDGLSRAYDLVIIKNGTASWDPSDYMRAAEIGRALGLDCGAFWERPDFPHFQLPDAA